MVQNDAAAERSAHVVREAQAEDRCAICGGPWAKGGASYAVRVGPPMMQACSQTCAADPRFTGAKVPEPEREPLDTIALAVMRLQAAFLTAGLKPPTLLGLEPGQLSRLMALRSGVLVSQPSKQCGKTMAAGLSLIAGLPMVEVVPGSGPRPEDVRYVR